MATLPLALPAGPQSSATAYAVFATSSPSIVAGLLHPFASYGSLSMLRPVSVLNDSEFSGRADTVFCCI